MGGTKEAAARAAELGESKPDARIVTSLAGRTREPAPVAGEVRVGGFGGTGGLAKWINREHVTQVIDATHPFATQISSNAKQACNQTNTPLEIRTRALWPRQAGDDWREVENIDAAIDEIPPAARVLLALGSQHIAPFAKRSDVWFLVRMVDPPDKAPPLPHHELLLQRPSPDWRKERDVLVHHAISHIICRNSGGPGAYAKIEAARDLGLPVIMIGRPSG